MLNRYKLLEFAPLITSVALSLKMIVYIQRYRHVTQFNDIKYKIPRGMELICNVLDCEQSPSFTIKFHSKNP